MSADQIAISPPVRAYYGTCVHSLSLLSLEYLQNALIGVNAAGVIAFIDKDVAEVDIEKKLKVRGWEAAVVVRSGRGEFFIPGLVDTHTHAPQFPNLGLGGDLELMDWLTHITIPTEAKVGALVSLAQDRPQADVGSFPPQFANPSYAREVYESVVQRVINSGTTTCCYYGTIHLTTKILAAICHRKGQRAFVGKCNMDRNSAPNYTEKSAQHSLDDTKEFVSFVRTHCVSPTPLASPDGSLAIVPSASAPFPLSPIEVIKQLPLPPLSPLSPLCPSPSPTSDPSSPIPDGARQRRRSSLSSGNAGRLAKNMFSKTSLVQPILTPRFAISCSDELLRGLGAMMGKDETLLLQTHLAENGEEIRFTKELFPFAKSYTAVYDHFNLLRSNTILAHCVHLDDSELELIKSRNVGISHCPTSNSNLRSGFSKLGEMLDRGIKVSLGTDVSGGFGVGVLSAIRQASIVSKTVALGNREKALNASIQLASSDVPVKGDPHPASAEDTSTSTPTPAPGSTTAPDAAAPTKFASAHLSLETLFFLATLGGAQVTCLQDRIGNFQVGKEFDALLIQTGQREVSNGVEAPNGEGEWVYDDEEEKEYQPVLGVGVGLKGMNPNLFVEPEDGIQKLFEKFLYAGDDRNIAHVFVRGRCIGGARRLL